MHRLLLISFLAVAAFAQTPSVTGVVNEASFGQHLSPGVDAAIFGTNFGSGPTSTVTVTVGAKQAAVLLVSPNQINAEIPVDAPVGTTTLTVAVNGVSSPPFSINLETYAPAFLTQNGLGTGAALIRTAGGVNITTAAPAHPNDVVVGYTVGLGATNPVTPTGATSPANSTATLPVVMVGNTPATVLFAGVGGGTPGLYQINFQVPGGLTGVQFVTVSIGGKTSPPTTLALAGANAAAFGSIDTPANNSTNISGAIGFTGWTLSVAGLQTLALWREPVTGEAPSSNGLIFLGSTAFVPGARPDVAATYPGYPQNTSGWGAQILTNELPNSSGSGPIGNGTYRIHVLATDNSSQVTDLGAKTITVNNTQSQLPFGTIDTPAVGATIFGNAYVNFGWAVTPNAANVIPKDGSTITVYIDNVPVGHPTYNQFRQDIATLFPGLQNSNGAVGFFMIDTETLAPGLHTIAWVVTDSAGNAQGLGSRFFVVQNSVG